MAELKHARILRSERVGEGLHHLVCEAEHPLGARAGQWAAVATEVPHPHKPGDVLRRAWSLAAIDGARFELLVSVVGACTEWLATRRAGETVAFTGPWGSKFLLDEGAHPAAFYATGSGISPIAALADAALAAGRDVAVWWDTPAVPDVMAARIARWRAAGATVSAGPGVAPGTGDAVGAAWWLAGDGARLDRVAASVAGSAVGTPRIERFYPLEPK